MLYDIINNVFVVISIYLLGSIVAMLWTEKRQWWIKGKWRKQSDIKGLPIETVEWLISNMTPSSMKEAACYSWIQVFILACTMHRLNCLTRKKRA